MLSRLCQKYEKYDREMAELEADIAYQVKAMSGEAVSPSTSSISGPTVSTVSDVHTYENEAFKNSSTSVGKAAENDVYNTKL